MPATHFRCPDGSQVLIADCLNRCPLPQRCMFLPTLRAVAASLNRTLSQPSVTELIAGVRETYLKKNVAYSVDPQSALYALHGSAVHTLNERHAQGNILSEIRLNDTIASGQFDLYGQLLGQDSGVLGDIKITSSYKLMKALGRYSVSLPTGDIYKTGLKKGQPKYRKEWRQDGVRHVLDWAIQLNYYRILIEQQGLTVSQLVIQALCRDNSLRIAAERSIDRPVYLIPIHKISDIWIRRYMQHKADMLNQALTANTLPPVCRPKERWHNRKCRDYCPVADHCPHGRNLAGDREYPLKVVS